MINSDNKFAIIFDLDGVIIDSVGHNRRSINMVLESYGLTKEDIDKDHPSFRGRPLKNLVDYYVKEFNVKIEFNDFAERANQLTLASLRQSGIKPDKALVRLLEECVRKNIPFGIGTSSTPHRAIALLRILGLEHFFSVIVTEAETKNHKPDPEVFLTVAQKLGVPPSRCVVIEDAKSGIEAAKRGGMKVVGYGAFMTDKERLAGADLVVNDFDELDLDKLLSLLDS